MKLAFHQPNFLSNLGFFYKMKQVDKFVVISNLQFQKGEGWQRRHKIKTSDGDQWLTVPVLGSQNQLIRDVKINNTVDWRRKQARALQMAYGAVADKELLQSALSIYDQEYERLVDVNVAFIKLLKEILDIDTELVIDEEVGGEKEELIVNVCVKHGANVYLSGLGGKDYMTDKHFNTLAKSNIECQFVERDVTSHYKYSTIHYLLTHGRDAVKKALEGVVEPTL